MPFDPSPRELTRDVEKGVILALLSEPAETPSQVEPARTRYDGFPTHDRHWDHVDSFLGGGWAGERGGQN